MNDAEKILKQKLKRLDTKRSRMCADIKVFENEITKLLQQINKVDQQRLEVCEKIDGSIRR